MPLTTEQKGETMKSVVIAAVAACGISGGAFAAQCHIVGSWTDTYGVVAMFTSQTAGTATAPSSICSIPYKLKVTRLTTKVFDVTGTAKNCPTIKAALKFAAGSCTKASGTISGGGLSEPDTWTKTAAALRTPDLFGGLKQ